MGPQLESHTVPSGDVDVGVMTLRLCNLGNPLAQRQGLEEGLHAQLRPQAQPAMLVFHDLPAGELQGEGGGGDNQGRAKTLAGPGAQLDGEPRPSPACCATAQHQARS